MASNATFWRGVPLAAEITGANVDDKWRVGQVLDAVVPRAPRGPRRPEHLCLDKGYDYTDAEAAVPARRITPPIRRIGERALLGCVQGKPRRWVVERTNAWHNHFRVGDRGLADPAALSGTNRRAMFRCAALLLGSALLSCATIPGRAGQGPGARAAEPPAEPGRSRPLLICETAATAMRWGPEGRLRPTVESDLDEMDPDGREPWYGWCTRIVSSAGAGLREWNMTTKAPLIVLLALVGASCTSPDEARCGDGVRNAREECDSDDIPARCHAGAGTIACRPDCTIDASGCSAYCGDGILNGTASEPEECDGVSMVQTCYPGAGTLGCNPDCTIDHSGCSAYCGDGILNGSEECDGATGVPACSWWCGGSISCTADCRLVYGCGPGKYCTP